MQQFKRIASAIGEVAQSEEFEQFRIDAEDFLSAREQEKSAVTQIAQMSVSLTEAAEVLNRSFPRHEPSGQYTNVISPVVVPKHSRPMGWLVGVFLLAGFGIAGWFAAGTLDAVLDIFIDSNIANVLFGIHYWILLVGYIGFNIWKNSYIMVPDGCQALITRFGKLEEVVDAGRTTLFSPWRKVSYIVNITKEYPYNAPIREAPTEGRVNASVDLFLQFRVENPAEFIFTLGGAQGFAEKLENAISEVTRALIYEQKAEAIYDLVGESTQTLLDTLNKQFLPAVRFVNANITHAEPSSQQYRMDLAAPEMVRVAKEAYTYEYELKLRKEQDEGDFNRELASLQETQSEIRAEIARYQAQIDTAREKEFNRANAYARQLMIEAESESKANAAMLEAQALDIRALSAAYYPEILEYRFQQEILNKMHNISGNLPSVVHIGPESEQQIDFMQIARQMLGLQESSLFTNEDMRTIRERSNEVTARIKERSAQINKLVEEEKLALAEKVEETVL
ncbi:MAG: SPFH domain-containing protein [Chloroflexaceae bacterium]|nr:SPFH domain-containing protein [Chloroflexaceae bacterium]